VYATTYHRPKTIVEAVALYEGFEDASYLSGGHTLIPALKNRLAAPQHLIDVRAIPELSGITVTADKVVIGAATRHAAVAACEEVKAAIPALCGLGGSTANNDPAADYPSAVLSLDAVVHTDRRVLSADDFFQGLYTTALEPGEILVRIEFRIPEIAGYAKFRNPASRYSMAAAFVSRHRDGKVRVAITGAGNGGVFRWSEAEERLAADLTPAALDGLALDPSLMMGDMHAPADYRAHLVAVMSRRAVENLGRTYIL
jgi:carbon-monoxide dehydrogenase medium subunit